MTERAMRFGLGLFLLATLCLLALLLFWFGSFPNYFKSHYQYTIVFPSAPGVGPGTPVRRSGVNIGEVRKIELDDATGKVRVAIEVEKKHPMRKGDKAILTHGLLGGDTSIEFVNPGAEGQQAEPGEEFAGAKQSDVQSLLDQTTDLVPNTQATLDEMRKSMQRLERLAPRLEEAASEHRDLAKSLREMVPEMRRTNDEIRELAKASREVVPEMRRTNDEILVATRNWGKLGERLDVLVQTNQDKLVKTLEDLNNTISRIGKTFSEENQRNLSTTLKNVRAGSENLENVTRNTEELVKESRQTIKRVNESVTQTNEVLANLQNATKPMAERSNNVMRNLDESTDKLNRTLNDARDLIRALSQSDGTLRLLVNDPALYNNLNDAACMITRLLPRLDRVMKDVEVFADKIARHPESIGLGGVINPSSGLKQAPTNGPHWQH